MKRKHIDYCKELYSHYSCFKWNKCSKCGDDFRREKGWRALVHFERWTYLCHDCAPTRGDADKYFLSKEWLLPRPPPPKPQYPNGKK